MMGRHRDRRESEGAQRVRRLGVLRIMCLAPCLGLSIACLILLAIGAAKLFVGDLGLLRMLPTLIVNGGIVLGLSRVAVPWIDRQLVEAAREETGPDVALPLLELVNGFPVGALSAPLGAETARALDSSDEAWWSEHSHELRKQFLKVVAAIENPSSLMRVDAEWVKPFLDAAARAGRTELLPRIERLEARAATLSISPELREAISACGDSLRKRARHNQDAATLLRSAQGGNDLLLHPAGSAEVDSNDSLLRPSESAEPIYGAAETSIYQPGEQPSPEARLGAHLS